MLRFGLNLVFLAFAACAAPSAHDSAASLENAPGVLRGTQDSELVTRISGGQSGIGTEMRVGISRPIVVSVGGVRVEHESLCMDWLMQVQAEFGEHFNGVLIDLSKDEAEQIVHSIPLPPGAELRIQYGPMNA